MRCESEDSKGKGENSPLINGGREEGSALNKLKKTQVPKRISPLRGTSRGCECAG